MRRADDEVALVAILEAQQFRAVARKSARILPQLERLHGWHQQFQRPALFISSRTMFSTLRSTRRTERHPGVDAGGNALDRPARSIIFWLITSASAGASFESGERTARCAWDALNSLRNLILHGPALHVAALCERIHGQPN